MNPIVSELLSEARSACLKILELVDGFTLEDYLNSELHRFGVNWNVVILGEALNVALGEMEELEILLPSARRAIATRHRIAHGYRTIDNTMMWDIATRGIPALLTEIEAVLDG
jgi:uncharacterized protein with HEPN domain